MPAIELDNVRKTFGDFVAVEGLTLAIEEGALCGFIGPNGSGKTTTLRMIMRIYAPDSGRLVVLGNARRGPADDRVGYLPEERMLYKHMRVDETLTYLSRLKGHKPSKTEIAEWLSMMQLDGFARRRVQTFVERADAEGAIGRGADQQAETRAARRAVQRAGPGQCRRAARRDPAAARFGHDGALQHARHGDGGKDVRLDRDDF
jgi:ABC-type sugar transport system ATPase subunit